MKYTSEQENIINSTEEKVIVNAGPGTGKTTTVIGRAIRLFKNDKPVVIFGYSNESVNEIYDRILKLFRILKLYPEKSVGLKGKEKKPVYITTVDSFVWHILDGNGYQTTDIYDENIRNFLNVRVNLSFWSWQEYHMIVDEAQDIDENRFRCLEWLSRFFKSIYIFGDPRQRIRRNCGMRFKSLFLSPDFVKKPLSITHRFENKVILDFCNFYSSLRKDIHVPLKSDREMTHHGKIKFYNIGKINTTPKIVTFVRNVVKPLREKNMSVALISPVLRNEDNRTVKIINEIMDVMRDFGVAVTKSNEEHRENKSVLVTTMDSAKGMEFDVVFVYGLEKIKDLLGVMFEPGNGHDIFYSKIFVAFSRAKKEIGVLIHEENDESIMLLPKYKPLPKKMLEFFEITEEIEDKLVPEEKIHVMTGITNILNQEETVQRLKKFSDRNGVKYKDDSRRVPELEIRDIPIENENPEIIGEFVGLLIECYCNNSFPDILKDFARSERREVTYKEYYARRRMILLNVREPVYYVIKGEPYFITEQEMERTRLILAKKVTHVTVDEWILLTEILIHLQATTGRRVKIHKNHDLLGEIQKAAVKLRKILEPIQDIERACGMEGITFIRGYMDILCKKSVVELKYVEEIQDKHIFQTIFYMACCHRNHGLVINLKNGEIHEITLNNVGRWNLILKSFFLIRNIDYFLNSRGYYHEISGYITDVYDGLERTFERTSMNLGDPYDTVIEVHANVNDSEQIQDYVRFFRKNWEKSWEEERIKNLLRTSKPMKHPPNCRHIDLRHLKRRFETVYKKESLKFKRLLESLGNTTIGNCLKMYMILMKEGEEKDIYVH